MGLPITLEWIITIVRFWISLSTWEVSIIGRAINRSQMKPRARACALSRASHWEPCYTSKKMCCSGSLEISTNSDYRTIRNLFGIPETSVCLVVEEFCSAIGDHLLSKYIKIPVADKLEKVINELK